MKKMKACQAGAGRGKRFCMKCIECKRRFQKKEKKEKRGRSTSHKSPKAERQVTTFAVEEKVNKKHRMSRISGVTITTKEDEEADGGRSEGIDDLIDNLSGEDNGTESE